MAEGSSVSSHLKHMKDLSDRLAAINAAISEEDHVVTLLGSLPSSYTNLVTVLEAKNDLNFETVQQALLNEEQKKDDDSIKDSNHEGALLARTKKPKSDSRGCFNFGSLQHSQRDCPQLRRDKYPSAETAVALTTAAADEDEVAFVVSDHRKKKVQKPR